MIKEVRKVATKDMIHLVERFAMYDDVFNEYLNTLKLIDDGKALMFENFQNLSRNYRKNVQVFSSEALKLVKGLSNCLDRKSLNQLATGLSNYINELNQVFTCVDIENQLLDQQAHVKTMNRLEVAKSELCFSIKEMSLS